MLMFAFNALAPLLVGICAATCDLPVRRRHVTATWQSSFGASCFNRRSTAEEAASLRGGRDYFFMSAGLNQLDNGFHWFAMVLKEPTPISSVILKGIADTAANSKFRDASARIEAWTSNVDETQLGGDHCASKSITRLFRQKWSHCAFVRQGTDGAIDGGIFVATCDATVKTLLLIKDLTSKQGSGSGGGYMGFSDLILRAQKMQDVEEFRHLQVAVNSSITVRCPVLCNVTAPGDISSRQQICKTDGSCIAGDKIRIGSARPSHSGNYTCKSDSAEQVTSLAVLYPPARVSVSAGNGSCSAKSPHVIVFESDGSHPPGRHRCSATVTGAGHSAVQLALLRTQHSALSGSVTSWWSFSVAESVKLDNATVRVDCQAVQQLPSGIQFPQVTAATVSWTCSPSKPAESDASLRWGKASVALMVACTVGATIAAVFASVGFFLCFKARSGAVSREAPSGDDGNALNLAYRNAPQDDAEFAGATYADAYCEA